MADDEYVQGLDDMLKRFRRLGTQFKGNNAKNPINKALMAAGLPIMREAQALAQVFDDPDTPSSVAGNIVRSRVKNPQEMFEVGVMVRTNARDPVKNSRHWHFKEFGTVKQPAEPFLRPAGESKRKEADRRFVDVLDKSITKAAKS